MPFQFQDLSIETDSGAAPNFSYALYSFEGLCLYAEQNYLSLLNSDIKLKKSVDRFLDYGNIHSSVSGYKKNKKDKRVQLIVRAQKRKIYKIDFEMNHRSRIFLVHIELIPEDPIQDEGYPRQKFGSLKDALLRSLKLERTYFYLLNVDIYNHPFLYRYENQIYEAVFFDLRTEFLTITNRQNACFRVSPNQIFFSYQINKPDVDINWIPSSLISYMKNTVRVGEYEFNLKLSIGGYHTPEADTSPRKILKELKLNLEKAMAYPFSRYSTQSHNDSSNMISIYLALRNSVQKKELEMYYQPILSAKNRKVHSCEALTRWRNPEQSMVSPDIFIPLAEESGLISSIGAWAIQNALKDLIHIKHHCLIHPDLLMSINLSPFQLKNPEFADNFIAYFLQLNLAPHSVVLELTESRFEETPPIIEQMRILKQFGFQIAIDDFGIGNSNFSRVEKIESDYVKLDKSLILGADTNDSKRGVLKAISKVLSSLGKKTVFEGIENSVLERIALDCGADFLQGFYYSKPMSLAELKDSYSLRFQ